MSTRHRRRCFRNASGPSTEAAERPDLSRALISHTRPQRWTIEHNKDEPDEHGQADGTVAHAEIELGASVIMIGDA
jgi:hypothetical protein